MKLEEVGGFGSLYLIWNDKADSAVSKLPAAFYDMIKIVRLSR